MDIKYLDFGTKYKPQRCYDYDAGMDIFLPRDIIIKPNETKLIPLGFGAEIPAGFVGFILMRSSFAKQGLLAGHSAIDATYSGEISAIITNASDNTFKLSVGDRICSLMVQPVILFNWTDKPKLRHKHATGFTGTKEIPNLDE